MGISADRDNADCYCWVSPSHLKSQMEQLFSPSTHRLFNPGKDAMPQANTRCYISGPVTGIHNFNREEFAAAQNLLTSLGIKVFNPSHIEGPLDPLKDEALWQYYMHFCIRNLPECDSVFMLPGWENSKGAKEEHRLARVLGIPCFYAPVPDEPYVTPKTTAPHGDDDAESDAAPSSTNP